MNLDNVRSSFIIYNLDPIKERQQFISKSLENREFVVKNFLDSLNLLTQLKDNPPHILFVNIASIKNVKDNFIKQIKDISPETRIIITASKKSFSEAYRLFDSGVFDYIFSNFFDGEEVEEERRIATANVLKTADHAVEMDYFKFKNEQLEDSLENNKNTTSVFVLHNLWLKKLKKCDNFTTSIDSFMEEISRFIKSSEMIYLKYVPAYKSLVSARAKNIQDFTVGETFDLQNLLGKDGIDEDSFETSSLFRDMLYNYTNWDHFTVIPLRVNGQLKGIFILQNEEVTEANSYVLACVNSLALKVSNIVLERKLHTVNHKDETTDLFNRKYLMGRLKDEMSRARRIKLPLSFLLISFDNFNTVIEDHSSTEVESILRLFAKLLSRTSRINDIVGKISSDEFGIILPHTPFQGALVKAERIRELIASTDISEISSKVNHLTVSLGVSEYPSHCLDVDDMLLMADKAMIEVSRYGGNQVCLSSPLTSFKPDFVYK